MVALVPGLLFETPLSWDALNHAARLSVLEASANDPIRAFYEVRWGLIPNLAIDAMFAALTGSAGPEAFIRGVWGASVVLPVAGAWALARALWGRTPITLLLALPISYNLVLSVGLFNFALGLALGLGVVALWIMLRDASFGLRMLVFNIAAVLLFFLHVVALAAVLAVVASLEVCAGPGWPTRREFYRCLTVPMLMASGIALALAAAPLEARLTVVSAKWIALTAPVQTFQAASDAVALIGVIGGMALLILRGGLTVHKLMRGPLALLAMVIIVVPSSLGPGSFLDARLAVFAAFALVASADTRRGASSSLLFAGIVCAATLVRVALVLPAWSDHAAAVREIRAALSAIPFGSTVMVTHDGTACGSLIEPYQHSAALVVLERHSYSNILFAGAGMQPVQLKPAYRALFLPWQALSADDLARIRERRLAEGLPPAEQVYNYVVHFHCGASMRTAPYPGLRELGTTPLVAIYGRSSD